MDCIKNRQCTLLVCALLLAMTLGAFWPVFRNGFVKYDDPDYVTENLHVTTGLTAANAEWAFRTGHGGNWHPLTWLSHMLDVQLFGLEAARHHLVSLVLHAANVMLLFLLLNSMTGSLWRSGFVAALFALHPLHVESVAWASERKDVLSTFLGLLCLLAYVRAVRAPELESPATQHKTPASIFHLASPIFYFLSLLCFALSLMSKSMLVTMPCLLLLLDFWPLRRLRFLDFNTKSGTRWNESFPVGRALVEKIPFLALSLGSSVVTFLVQREGGAVSSLDALPIEFRISNAFISYVRYVAKTLWPENLAVFYPLPTEWPGEMVLGAAILIFGLTGLVVWLARRAPYAPVGWFWFLGTLVPVIGIIQVGRQAMADRYSYVPLIGLFIVIVWALSEIPNHWPGAKIWVTAGGVAALGVCAGLTWRQLGYWKDNRTLFAHALEATRDNPVAQNNLGVSLLEAGEKAEAEAHFAEAVRLKPNYTDGLVNLGICREKQGRAKDAIELFRKAAAGGQATAAAHYNLANLLSQQGELEEADSHYQAALKLNPEMVDAIYNLGILKAKQGRNEEAVKNYLAVLRLKPGFVDAHLNVAAVLFAQGNVDEAIEHFNAALRAAPDNADVQFNLASALNAKGDYAQAEIHYTEACRLRPEDLAAREGLGLALLYLGKSAAAYTQFQELLRLRPDAASHHDAALALDAQGQAEQAVTHYQEATRLATNAPLYLNDLAWILATHPSERVRNAEEAVRLAEEACRLSGGKEPRFWGTLDASYAGAGRFEDAVKAATKAHELALAVGQKEIARAAEERLALYQAGKPYRSQPFPGAQP